MFGYFVNIPRIFRSIKSVVRREKKHYEMKYVKSKIKFIINWNLKTYFLLSENVIENWLFEKQLETR